MKVSKIRIFDVDLSLFTSYLVNAYSFTYTNQSETMTILGAEEYYWRNSAYQMNMVILKKEDNHVLIDIVGAAGASSLFNISWGSEKSFIKKIKRLVELIFANQNIHSAPFEFYR